MITSNCGSPGRTTRMLEKAIEHARRGERVCIITADHKDEARILRQIALMAKNQGCSWIMDANVQVFRAGCHPVKETRPGEYRVGSFDEVTLVDHAVFETNYPAVIKGWLESQHDNC